jgi:rhodanese-related sulfurtransferase
MRKMMLRAGPAAVPVLLVLLATRLGRPDSPRVEAAPARYANLVAAARRSVRAIPAARLRGMLADGAPLALIDVREDSEWEQGRLPGAIHLGKGILERDIEKARPDPGARIVVYCSGGARSALAAESLGRMGYGNVFSLDGGVKAWSESGGGLVK